jgi:Family of unknown function (DUF6502)
MTLPPLPPPAPDAMLRPLNRLLRPLVRLLIRSGVTFPVLVDLLRTLYVDVANRDLLDPRVQTDSRISLMTGVHRKEIRRLRSLAPGRDEIPAVVTLSSEIIARWLGTPAFTDATGALLPLPRLAQPDGGPSFDSLVGSVTTDVRPRAVLDDWISQGIVTLDQGDRVHLNARAFVPRPGRDEQLFYFARNLHDHIAAAAANISAEGAAPFFDRSVHYDQLPREASVRLEAAGREAAQALLLDVNRLALKLTKDEKTGPAPPAGTTRRVNLGVYVYVEDEPGDTL